MNDLLALENAFDTLVSSNLSESKINTFETIMLEHRNIPHIKIIEIIDDLINTNDNRIIVDKQEFYFEPILNESSNLQSQSNIMTLALPNILKTIPKNVLSHLTETHIIQIVKSIMNIPLMEDDTYLTINNKINEMLTSGDILIPVQGLRRNPEKPEIIVQGVLAPLLYKPFKLDKCSIKKGDTLKKYLQRTNQDENTPLMDLLPKHMVKLRKLI